MIKNLKKRIRKKNVMLDQGKCIVEKLQKRTLSRCGFSGDRKSTGIQKSYYEEYTNDDL